MRPLLGTFVEVGARGPAADEGIEAAFASLESAQGRWSFQDPGSELSRLNGSAGERVPVHAQTLRLLRACVALMRRSEGCFDCTVGGQLVHEGVLPDHGGQTPLPRGCAEDIETGPGWARLRRPLRLTLDGIAKGFAVDLAIAALRRAQVTSGWVNAGGDLRVFGDLALPVHRREMDGRLTPLGAVREAAVASTRCGPRDASFPSCVLAPAGAAPTPGVWTVLARSAWRADALAKVAAVAPAARRAALVEALGGCLLGGAPRELAA